MARLRVLVASLTALVGLGACSDRASTPAPQRPSPSSPAQPAPTPLRLGYQRVAPYLAYFVADEKGFFRAEQLDVRGTEFPSSNVLGLAQVAGQVDGSGFISFPVVFGIEQNAPGQMVCELVLPMTRASRFAAIVVPNGSPITRPQELRGKRIGTYPSSTNVIYARMMLERLFGSAGAAEIVQVQPASQFELLGTGRIDALVGPEPMPSTAAARGLGQVLQHAPDAHYVMDPMPVGCATLARAYAAAHPDVATRMRRALERGVDYLRDPSHATEVRGILARRTGIDAAVGERIALLDYAKIAEADRASLQRLADLLERERVLERHVNTATLLPAP